MSGQRLYSTQGALVLVYVLHRPKIAWPLHSHQHWPLLKTCKMPSIFRCHFLDPCGLDVYKHFQIFLLVSWSIADILCSGADFILSESCRSFFARVWCWLHMSHTELQLWCRCELNIQMHFSSGKYHSQVALFHSSLTTSASVPEYIILECFGV